MIWLNQVTGSDRRNPNEEYVEVWTAGGLRVEQQEVWGGGSVCTAPRVSPPSLIAFCLFGNTPAIQ